MVDTKLLRTTGAILNIVRGESETGNNIIEAADRIDELEAMIAGAKVVEVDTKHGNGCKLCPFLRLKPRSIQGCIYSSKEGCPIRRGAVIVKMKKEQ